MTPDVARSFGRRAGRLADDTPADRDRVVDAVRAASIVVVVVWHWSLSITHRDDDGHLVNPNPIADVPFGWTLTWLLQVMPLFFIVGGFANFAGWRSSLDSHGPRWGAAAGRFLGGRARRLLAPVVVFVAAWGGVELIARAVVDDHRSPFETAAIVFVPLWFVGAYLWVVVLVPVTAALHRRWPAATLAALATTVAAVDLLRFGVGIDAARWANTALVWVLVHQLGYLWADGTITRWPPRRWLAVGAGGLAIMATLTALPAYPRSMVGTAEAEISHMYPTTAVIGVLAATQLAFVMAVRPAFARWLRRRRPWVVVVAANAVIMTVFVWHMTALYGAILLFEAAGGTLGAEPTLEWWLARPVWLVGPAVVLAPLVVVFAPVELGRRPP